MKMQSKNKKQLIVTLFLTFLKIGAFTFGGGYAMIPFIDREIVRKRGWLTPEEMLDIVSVAEATPGPIAINSATFVGTRVAGFFGSLAATIGVVIPSFVIILAISCALDAFSALPAVQYAFMGLRAAVLVLIASAFISLFNALKKDWFTIALLVLSFALVAFTRLATIWVIIIAGFIGIASVIILRKRCKK